MKNKKLWVSITGIIAGLILILGSALVIYPAVQSISGLAVAQSTTQWNNLKDANVGDNLTSGILASGLMVFDGTNFDRARGSTTLGLLVDTELPAAAALADATANPTTPSFGAFLQSFNGTTWDRVRGDTTNGLDVDITRLPEAAADNSTNSILKIPVLNSRANAAAPTWTEGKQVPLSVDLSGALRMSSSGTTIVIGNDTPADTFANPTDFVGVFSLNAGFNGTTWDRILSAGNNADAIAVSTLGIQKEAAFGHSFNGTTWDRLLSAGNNADAVAVSTTGVQKEGAFTYGFNGTTWDRIITDGNNSDAIAVSTIGVIKEAAFNYGFNGTTWDRWLSQGNNADAIAVSTLGVQKEGAFHFEFNGTTFDRVRNAFTQSTTTITTNAAGTTVTMTTTPMSKYTMIVDRTVGSTDVVDIRLECSINNTAFVQIAQIISLAAEPALAAQDGTPCDYMRYDVITIGAGNTVSIDILAIR